MQRKAEESATYFSNLGLQPAAAYEAKPEDKLNSDSSSKVKYVEDPFSGGSLGDLMAELGPPIPAGYGDVKVVKGSKGDTGTPGEPGASGENGTNGTNGITGENGIDGTKGIDGTNGIDGRNGEDGGGGGGNGEDTFRKYFGKGGNFIYMKDSVNYGNIASDNSNAGSGNFASGESSKVYATTTGHIFGEGDPNENTPNPHKPIDYSINGEYFAGNAVNNMVTASDKNTEPTRDETSKTTYGITQEGKSHEKSK